MMIHRVPGEAIQENESQHQYQPYSSFSTIGIASSLARTRHRAEVEVKELPVVQALSWSLPHNARVQQVNFADVLALSTGNLLQLFLLSLINPSVRYQSSFTNAQLNTLRRNQALSAYADNIAQGLQEPSAVNRDELRHNLRQLYVIAAAAGGMPPPDNDDNPDDWRSAFNNSNGSHRLDSSDFSGGSGGSPGDDLPLQIANEIALIYYTNLELTLDDVQAVINKYFPQKENLQTINDAFINKIVHARLDKGRYELLSLLPDKDFIKAAVEKLKGNNNYKVDDSEGLSFFKRIANKIFNWWNGSKEPSSPLQIYKNNISKAFDKYISWWKFSWFGHHHDKRARVIKAQLQSSRDVDEMKAILQRQEMIMSQKDEEQLPKTSWQDSRWNNRDTLKNVPINPNTSGYYKAITEALEIKSPSP